MEIQVALLEWINTFALAEEVKSLGDLTDGHFLWDILRDVDPTYFTSSLPEGRGNATKWNSRYENLKFLHKTLVSYISEECGQALFAPRAGEGLHAIAKDSSIPELVRLFQLVLQATIFSPRQEEYILKMTSLTSSSQQALKQLIQDKEPVEEPNGQEDGASESPSTFAHDPELELEERIGRIMAENERMLQERKDMQGEMRSLDDRLIRLQDNNAVLQQRLEEAEDRLQMNGPTGNGSDGHSVKDLESKIQQQENDFADQEARMAKQARKAEALQKKIDNLEVSLNSSAKKAQDARDELDEVTKERDALTRKANMVDKFKQQLQASNGLKKENETLWRQLDECRADVDALQQAGRDKIRLETELEEFKKLMPRIEEDNAELFRTKRQLELDNESLHKRWSTANKQHKQDQETIAQLQQGVGSSSISSVGSQDDDTLEGEFSGVTDSQTRAEERTSNIEKQNKQLQSIAEEQASKILTLQRLLDEANSRSKPQNDTRRPSFTTSASGERLSPAQSTEAVQRLRAQLDGEEIKRKKVDDKLRRTIQELDLAKKDLAYVGMDKLEMVAQIKADNSSELRDLQTEHTLLQEINDRLESENREHRDLLSKSIGQNATLQDQSKLSQEIRDLAVAVKEGQSSEDPSKRMDIYSHMIMAGRKELVETQKEVEQQRTTIADLEKRLADAEADAEARRKEAEEEKPPSPNPNPDILSELTALRTANTNLKREQRLMASAFHDQGSRLQLSNVTLQRRSEQPPASWLGKQRRIVEGNLGGGFARRW